MKKALSIFFSAVVVIALLFPSTYFNAEENNEAKEGRNISEENIKEDDVQVNDKKDVGNINVEVNDNDEKQVKDDEETNEEDELVEILGARWECVDKGFGNNKPVDVVIRPEDVELVDPSEGTLQGEVTSLIFKGVHYELDVMAGGYEWLVHSTDMVAVGEEVGIQVDPFDIQIMNKPESEDEEAVPVEE